MGPSSLSKLYIVQKGERGQVQKMPHSAICGCKPGHIFRLLTKPCAAEELAVTLEATVVQHRLAAADHLLENTLRASAKALTEVRSLVHPAQRSAAPRAATAMYVTWRLNGSCTMSGSSRMRRCSRRWVVSHVNRAHSIACRPETSSAPRKRRCWQPTPRSELNSSRTFAWKRWPA